MSFIINSLKVKDVKVQGRFILGSKVHNECCRGGKVKDLTFPQTLSTMEMQDSNRTWKNMRPLYREINNWEKSMSNLGFCVMQEALSVDKLTTNLPSIKAALNNHFLSDGKHWTNNQTLQPASPNKAGNTVHQIFTEHILYDFSD